jgi:hypothetical protein
MLLDNGLTLYLTLNSFSSYCWFLTHSFYPCLGFKFCDVATLANHPQEELAKFGYTLESKVFKKN